MSLDSYVLYRQVLIEKNFLIELHLGDDIHSSYVWYFEPKYKKSKFRVREATKQEILYVINNKVYCTEFKSRCLAGGFYVITGEFCNDLYIGKRDSIIKK